MFSYWVGKNFMNLKATATIHIKVWLAATAHIWHLDKLYAIKALCRWRLDFSAIKSFEVV